MSLVEDNLSWPAKTTCQIYFIQGNGVSAMCSGILIDPEIVLTAGHCVYNDSGWAQSATVVPATHQGDTPYGSATGIYFYSFNDWIEDTDWDYDIGLVILDRPVGMLTGFAGWRNGVDCDYIDNHSFTNFSYPADATCDGNGPLHNGEDIYVWGGSFDDCESIFGEWEVDFDEGSGCFGELCIGMSGSAAITYDDGHWRAVATASHKANFFDTADYVRMNHGFDELMHDQAMPYARGSDFDLQPLRFTAYEDVIVAGQTITGSYFNVANPTNGSGTGPWYYTLLLSDNDQITYTDTYISQGGFDADMPPLGWEFILHGPIDIPISTPTGTHYLGVHLIPGSDSDDSNNDTSGWDAHQIVVDGGPQIYPTLIESDDEDDIYVEGDPLSYFCQITNEGGDTVTKYYVNLRLTSDQSLDVADDPSLGYFIVNDHLPGTTRSITGSMNIPIDITPGGYYLGVICHAHDDLDESDDTAISSTSIGVWRQADADDCAEAEQIEPGLHPFTTFGATTDGYDHVQCKNDGPHNDIWLNYQPPQVPCQLRVTTCEELGGTANFDTAITVLQGATCGALSVLGCNDDDYTQPCGYDTGGYQSTVDVLITEPGTVWIRVGGHEDLDWGSGELLVESDYALNNYCEDAIDLPLGLTSFDTTLATTDGSQHEGCQWDGQTYNDIWYKFKATYSGILTVTTCEDLGGNADYDSDLAMYQGPCESLVLLDCNDDDTNYVCGTAPPYQSTVTAEVQAGDDVQVRVGGYGWNSIGTGTLNVTLVPVNDECENAIGFQPGDLLWYMTHGATSNGPDHPVCESNGDGGGTWNDIWYTFTAPCSGQFQATNCNWVNYDSDLVLYQQGCDPMEFVACSDDACDAYGDGLEGRASDLSADVVLGTTYLLRIGGSDGPEGIGQGTLLTQCVPYSGDTNNDGIVDINDLLKVMDNWGLLGSGADLNNDGVVDIEDLLLVITNWS